MVLREKSYEMEEDARNRCDAPRPGAIVRDVRSQGLYRVVDVRGFGLRLDTLGDKGILRNFMPDWLNYDVLQDGEAPMPFEPAGPTEAQVVALAADPEFAEHAKRLGLPSIGAK